MLEKVINITPGSDYKKSTGNPKYVKKFSSYGYQSVSTNDTIQISPATSLLSSYGWKIINLQNEGDIVEIAFEIDGFEFDTKVSINELNQTSRFEYKIRKNFNGYETEMLITVRLSAPVQKNYSNGKYPIEFITLGKLFDQIKSLSVQKPKLITDIYIIDSISFDLRQELTKEFQYINNCLVKFFEKYISYKPNFHHSNDGEHISIKSIQIQ